MLLVADAGFAFATMYADIVNTCLQYVPNLRKLAQVSDEQMKELAVKTETTNPWYWGVRTLVKVSLAVHINFSPFWKTFLQLPGSTVFFAPYELSNASFPILSCGYLDSVVRVGILGKRSVASGL